MCCFREVNNFEKFNNIVQVILNKAISYIQTLPKDCEDEQEDRQRRQSKENENRTEDGTNSENESTPSGEKWSLEEKDKLITFAGKVFLTNFPIYVAYKHTVHSSLDELSNQEAAALNNYCELNVSI